LLERKECSLTCPWAWSVDVHSQRWHVVSVDKKLLLFKSIPGPIPSDEYPRHIISSPTCYHSIAFHDLWHTINIPT